MRAWGSSAVPDCLSALTGILQSDHSPHPPQLRPANLLMSCEFTSRGPIVHRQPCRDQRIRRSSRHSSLAAAWMPRCSKLALRVAALPQVHSGARPGGHAVAGRPDACVAQVLHKRYRSPAPAERVRDGPGMILSALPADLPTCRPADLPTCLCMPKRQRRDIRVARRAGACKPSGRKLHRPRRVRRLDADAARPQPRRGAP